MHLFSFLYISKIISKKGTSMKKNLNYNSCGREEVSPKAYIFAEATGPVPYTLTNDYLFRAVFQSNEKALRGLLCALLHLKPEDIKSLFIQNPIEIGKRLKQRILCLISSLFSMTIRLLI